MFAVFMSLVGALTPIICGKYEVALVLPQNSVQAEHLLGIALYFAFGISIALAVIFSFTGGGLLSFLNADKLGWWIFSVPAAMFLVGVFTAVNYYANRNKDYNRLSRAKICRALLSTLISIAAGLLGGHFGGLLAGFFAGLAGAAVYLLFQYPQLMKLRLLRWSKAKKWLLWKYRYYPIYNATSGLLNGLTMGLPVFFMSHYFSENIVGYYSLVLRVSLAPLSFIAASASQINLKKVVDLVNRGQSPVPFLLKLTALLLFIILIPCIIIILWGPSLFYFLFGGQWSVAGEFARILMPAIAIQFIASTLSSTRGATNNNQYTAFYRIVNFIVTFSVLMVFAKQKAIYRLLYALSVTNFMLGLLNYYLSMRAAKNPKN